MNFDYIVRIQIMSKILHTWIVVSAMTTGEEDIAMLTVFTWLIAALE